MLKLLQTISEDDNAVKAVFDHIRNAAICGLLGTIGNWFGKQSIPLSGFTRYNYIALAVGFGISALFLYMVNFQNGLERIRKSAERYGNWVLLFVLFHSWLGFSAISYFIHAAAGK